MCDTNPAALLRAQNTCVYVSSHLIHSQHGQDDVLEALQFQLLAISQKDQRKRTDVKSGKEEFFTDAHELKKRFDE